MAKVTMDITVTVKGKPAAGELEHIRKQLVSLTKLADKYEIGIYSPTVTVGK